MLKRKMKQIKVANFSTLLKQIKWLWILALLIKKNSEKPAVFGGQNKGRNLSTKNSNSDRPCFPLAKIQFHNPRSNVRSTKGHFNNTILHTPFHTAFHS